MIEKRRDKKGRVLRNGECQRKDGLYQYDYFDLNGKTKCLYSIWTRTKCLWLPCIGRNIFSTL
ncbi:hypothetical protein D3Z45_21405 [Lachnospiraceae bacterium]|nr:hypothetical protein [Lachnospiraceae bacterium]